MAFCPPSEGMRACAAVGVVVTHVAFQTGHSSGVGGRLFGRSIWRWRCSLTVSGFLLWRGRSGAKICVHPQTGPSIAGGAHHAGLCGGGGRHLFSARRGSCPASVWLADFTNLATAADRRLTEPVVETAFLCGINRS